MVIRVIKTFFCTILYILTTSSYSLLLLLGPCHFCSLLCPSLNEMFPFSAVQSLSCIHLFMTSWTTAHQASLSITNSRSLLKFMSIESVMPSNHLILCHPILLLPSISPSIRVFSNASVLHIRWPKYCSFNFSISPSSEYSWLLPWYLYFLEETSSLSHSIVSHCFFTLFT